MLLLLCDWSLFFAGGGGRYLTRDGKLNKSGFVDFDDFRISDPELTCVGPHPIHSTGQEGAGVACPHALVLFYVRYFNFIRLVHTGSWLLAGGPVLVTCVALVLRCVVVCRRRCYQKAMGGMRIHGYR